MLLSRERLGRGTVAERYSTQLIIDRDLAFFVRCPSLCWARDSQPLHLVGERCPLEAQASCRSMSASDDPIAFVERSYNLLSLGLLQGVFPTSRAVACVIENFTQRHAQRWTVR